MIKLGDKVRDWVTGLEGVAIHRIEFLNGCIQFGVQPPYKTGATDCPVWNIDEDQLETVNEIKEKKAKNSRAGGPMSKWNKKSQP